MVYIEYALKRSLVHWIIQYLLKYMKYPSLDVNVVQSNQIQIYTRLWTECGSFFPSPSKLSRMIGGRWTPSTWNCSPTSSFVASMSRSRCATILCARETPTLKYLENPQYQLVCRTSRFWRTYTVHSLMFRMSPFAGPRIRLPSLVVQY